jgi:hypothetical protein
MTMELCRHPSMQGDICQDCGRDVAVLEGRKPVEYRDRQTGQLLYWSATGPNQRRPPLFRPRTLFDESPA